MNHNKYNNNPALNRIIKEEKAKILKEQAGFSYAIQDAIEGWAYRSGEELEGQLSQIDRDWNKNPEILDAIQIALDALKDNFETWRN